MIPNDRKRRLCEKRDGKSRRGDPAREAEVGATFFERIGDFNMRIRHRQYGLCPWHFPCLAGRPPSLRQHIKENKNVTSTAKMCSNFHAFYIVMITSNVFFIFVEGFLYI